MRYLKTKNLKTWKKPSSQRWLLRHLNDPFVAKAEEEGLRSRSAYKLKEVDEKHHIFFPQARVLDLGCAPGGWCEYAAKKVYGQGHGGAACQGYQEQALKERAEGQEDANSDKKNEPQAGARQGASLVVGIDLLPMESLAGVHFIQGDMEDEALYTQFHGEKFHIILSDMAPAFSGHRDTDRLKMENLMEAVLALAHERLMPKGTLFFKGFHTPFLTSLKPLFAKMHYLKPQASRAESREIYILAKGFRPPR